VLSELWRNPTTGAWGALPAGATATACPADVVKVPALVCIQPPNIPGASVNYRVSAAWNLDLETGASTPGFVEIIIDPVSAGQVVSLPVTASNATSFTCAGAAFGHAWNVVVQYAGTQVSTVDGTVRTGTGLNSDGFSFLNETVAVAGAPVAAAKIQKFVTYSAAGVPSYTDADNTPYSLPVGATVSVGACSAALVNANVPNCDGTTTAKMVDSVTATYLLNQKDLHTEPVYDVVTATFGGGIQYTYNAGRNLQVSRNFMTLANDGVVANWTDFGDGYGQGGSNPSHTYLADGEYDVNSYYYTSNGNKILVQSQKVTITNSTIVYNPAGTPNAGGILQNVNRSYLRKANTALQSYCGTTPVGSPYLANGAAYTPVGTITLDNPAAIDDLEFIGDFDPSPTASVLVEYDVEQYVEAGCAAGVPATRVTTTKFDKATGLAVGAPTVVEPAGFALGSCICVPISVDVPNCDGTLTTQSVDMKVGAYLLNQQKTGSMELYDVVVGTFGGNMNYVFNGPRNLTASRNFMTLTGDSVVESITDFGDGVWLSGPNPSHTYANDGEYEVKIYYHVSGGQYILVQSQKVTISAGTATYSPAGTPNAGGISQPASRNYNRVAGQATQFFCNGLPVGVPVRQDGTPYVAVGALRKYLPNQLDDRIPTSTPQTAVAAAAVAARDVELIYSDATKFHIGTTNYYSREVWVWDSQAIGPAAPTVTQYSTDGITWTAVVPGGTKVIGWVNDPVTRVTTTHLKLIDPVTGLIAQPENTIIVTSTYAPGSSVPVNTYVDMGTGLAWTGNPETQLAALPEARRVEVGLTSQSQKITGNFTIAAGYKSYSVMAKSAGVIVDGMAIDNGDGTGAGSSSGERFTDTVDIIGGTYLLVVTR
jgi:hypothetical protein